MPDNLDQLVSDVCGLTGAARPDWLKNDAPLLTQFPSEDRGFYLVGLIGGKDVGKSALVNALVGCEITAQTSHGPGTETAIAYAHQSCEPALRQMLEREIPGRYRIVTHDLPHLSRQVLLDLPDIDSIYTDHVTLTRTMLRHMLFPVWVQSVEKYADGQPQELLAKVAAGNSPANFIFCLNKVDQVAASAIAELQADYAQRLARTVALKSPPRVWAIAAIQPTAFELPALRDVLARQKSEEQVLQSREQAVLRRRRSILAWLDAQELPARAARLRRLVAEAEETLADRFGVPLLESFLPRLSDDPAYRQAVIDNCLIRRVAHWPIISLLHGFYSGIGALVRHNVEARARRSYIQNGESLVETHMRELASGEAEAQAKPMAADREEETPRRVTGRSVAALVQTTFAMLQQSHPTISELYRDKKFWEAGPAGVVAGQLCQNLAKTIDRQRVQAGALLDKPGGSLMFLWRSLLTIGALVWFIFLQPLLQVMTQPSSAMSAGQGIIFRAVQTLSPGYLLSAFFCLLIYFTTLWLILRWDTQRRLQSQFAAWQRMEKSEGGDPSLNLVAVTGKWIDALLDPISAEFSRVEAAAQRIESLRTSLMEEKKN